MLAVTADAALTEDTFTDAGESPPPPQAASAAARVRLKANFPSVRPEIKKLNSFVSLLVKVDRLPSTFFGQEAVFRQTLSVPRQTGPYFLYGGRYLFPHLLCIPIFLGG